MKQKNWAIFILLYFLYMTPEIISLSASDAALCFSYCRFILGIIMYAVNYCRIMYTVYVMLILQLYG